MKLRVALVALLAMLLVGCSEEAEPFFPPDDDDALEITGYDPALEPSAGVLPLVPEDATQLSITDFDQLRLALGFGTLDGSSPVRQRERFWRRMARTAALSDGMLRPFEKRLRTDFALGQDDVAWEAHYSGDDAEGWVLAFHPDLPTRRIRRAIQAEVGPLAGAVLDGENNIVTSAEVPALESSWADDRGLVAISGREANATYFERGCVPLEEVYGDGIVDQLEGQSARDVQTLAALEGYSVSLGGELATVRLGDGREDAFVRLRLAQHLPQLKPEFGAIFAGGVASPKDGELGYRMPRPARAAEWVTERRLPFAACDG